VANIKKSYRSINNKALEVEEEEVEKNEPVRQLDQYLPIVKNNTELMSNSEA